MYNPLDHYWLIAENGLIFSSKVGDYVLDTDPAYLAFIAIEENIVTTIDTITSLKQVLSSHGCGCGCLETLADKVNAKYMDLDSAFKAADNSLFAGYNDKQQKTFWLQVKEAEGFTADNQYPTPFIDGRVIGEQLSKAEIVATILAESAALKPYSGEVYGKIKRLIGALAEVDTAGDYASGCAAVDAIVW